MKEVLNLYKNSGETPLECIERFRAKNQEYKDVSMTYAGRLDPLAEGVLIVLAGPSVHKKNEFLAFSKKYEVEVLFSFETDTYDVLGLVEGIAPRLQAAGQPEFNKTLAEEVLKEFIGKKVFEYPSYSSKTVGGKPLFSLARSGELDSVEIPKKEIEIYNLEFISWREIKAEGLLSEIENSINRVGGDFRQEVCISKWKEVLENLNNNFYIAKVKAEVSSGTYMRTLAYEWGKKVGVPALAYKIIRTKVGDFRIEESEIF